MPLPDDLAKSLAQATAHGEGPYPGDIYRHYKGGLYVVVCRSVKEDTCEHLVTYRSNKRETIWTRTLENFSEMVGHSVDNPNGPCLRFTPVED